MKYRMLDQNGDYTFGQGNLNFYINVPMAVAQAVQTTLLLIQGEWYLDQTLGVPYFQGVLGQYSQEQADAVIRTAITQVQGVVSIASFESQVDPNMRSYSVTNCVINTIYGTTQVQFQNELTS